MQRINESLWIGGKFSLAKNDIRTFCTIICCTKTYIKPLQPIQARSIHVPMTDYSIWKDADFWFAKDNLDSARKAIVYCSFGLNRSAVLIATYLASNNCTSVLNELINISRLATIMPKKTLVKQASEWLEAQRVRQIQSSLSSPSRDS